jgi:ABC-2 type transport system permease protein
MNVARTSTINRYARIYAALWRNSVVREMSFKANFLLWIVVELLWFGLQLSFIAVIYQHTDRIATWSKWQVVFLVGASQFIQQIFAALFLSNCTQLSEYVRTGRLDFLLLLPASTRFLVSFRQVDLGAFVNALAGAAVMVYAGRQLQLHPTFGNLAGFLPLCAAGILIHYSLMFLLATVSFWTVRAQGIVWSYYNLFNLARLPDGAFRPGVFKAVFTFVLPMLLVANVPVKRLVALPAAPWEWPVLLILAATCFGVSEWAWRASVRHYTSASS